LAQQKIKNKTFSFNIFFHLPLMLLTPVLYPYLWISTQIYEEKELILRIIRGPREDKLSKTWSRKSLAPVPFRLVHLNLKLALYNLNKLQYGCHNCVTLQYTIQFYAIKKSQATQSYIARPLATSQWAGSPGCRQGAKGTWRSARRRSLLCGLFLVNANISTSYSLLYPVYRLKQMHRDKQ